jgi:anaerobic magnesium-protoporphyrin IX monomethyl ester cyclase
VQPKKVLLFDPFDDFLQGPREFTPLGVLYLSAWLKRAGHEVDVVHEEVNRIPGGYDFYGISATTPQYPKAKEALKKIKAAEPGSVVILGGAHANAERCRYEAINDGFDWVVKGEGEVTLQKIVESAEGGGMVEGERAPIHDIPYPDRTAIQILDYGFPIQGRKAATIMTARECPFKCQFCSSAGGVPRFHAVDYTTEEIRYLVEELDFRALLFVDDVFTFKESTRLKELCDWLTEYRKKYDIIWRCYSRTDLGLESLQMMADAGCVEVGAGVESGSQDILDVTMKYTTPEGNLQFIEACAKAGIMPNTFIMIGLPAETEATVIATRDWFVRAADAFTRYSKKPLHWGWNLFTPLPDCPNLIAWENNVPVSNNSGPRKQHKGRYAGIRMRDLIRIHPMPYELSVMKAKRGYITDCFVDTDTMFMRPEKGLSRERLYDLFLEGFDFFSSISGFDPRKRGDRK